MVVEVERNEKLKARQAATKKAEGHKARRVGRTYWKKDVSWVEKCPKNRSVWRVECVWRAEVPGEKTMMMVKEREFGSSRIWEDGPFLYTKDGQARSSQLERNNSEEGKKQSKDTGKKKKGATVRRQSCVQRRYHQSLCVYLRARRRRRERVRSGWKTVCLLVWFVQFGWRSGLLLYGQLDLEEGCGQNGGGASKLQVPESSPARSCIPRSDRFGCLLFFFFPPPLCFFRSFFIPDGCDWSQRHMGTEGGSLYTTARASSLSLTRVGGAWSPSPNPLASVRPSCSRSSLFPSFRHSLSASIGSRLRHMRVERYPGLGCWSHCEAPYRGTGPPGRGTHMPPSAA
jgi:hypothetical protein